MNSTGDRIDVMAEEKTTRSASRYDALIATFVGLCALCVSGYTAYMQRQQVRAMVWPILEFESSNDPNIHLSLTNKGVGPAIIRNVEVLPHPEDPRSATISPDFTVRSNDLTA